ncbi:hypothetical protein [Azospirillum thermophilum]|uniref:Uncharacterized protein n=1 Tax=Azospirillum thermophilum TaxID=2202148 RepID=A0A2S2CXS5_9PROT|nr:hypothetical protein [Azospirillum thermophilum]AWK89322.1 hypothetical protein DEW08_25070 [Azospirillum thermophilum]
MEAHRLVFEFRKEDVPVPAKSVLEQATGKPAAWPARYNRPATAMLAVRHGASANLSGCAGRGDRVLNSGAGSAMIPAIMMIARTDIRLFQRAGRMLAGTPAPDFGA